MFTFRCESNRFGHQFVELLSGDGVAHIQTLVDLDNNTIFVSNVYFMLEYYLNCRNMEQFNRFTSHKC